MLDMLQKCGVNDGTTSPATFRYSSVVTINALTKLGVRPVVTGLKRLNCDFRQMEGLKKNSAKELILQSLNKVSVRQGVAWLAGWVLSVVEDDPATEQIIVDQVAKENAAATTTVSGPGATLIS